MTLTDYQAKYIATGLTRCFPPDSTERIAATLVDAQVDLNILVITPSNLRKQWYQELSEKLFLSCRLLGSKSCEQGV